jgi:hypothetical protein
MDQGTAKWVSGTVRLIVGHIGNVNERFAL